MIYGLEQISQIFSIFHDGAIIRYSCDGETLDLDVEIIYLTERINRNFTYFRVTLNDVHDIYFDTWSDNPDSTPIKITSIPAIFEPQLEILSCNFEGHGIKIICNQPSNKFVYCGGELQFSAKSASVTDEAGRDYSLEELHHICENYWADWKKRHSKH